jgi:hypothetical protein
MPSLSNHQSSETVKLLFVGESGGGKTGALASLASAGYNLRILDMDNGLDVLANVLNDPKSIYDKGATARVEFRTITEKMKNVNGKLIPASATAWPQAIGMLSDWKEPGQTSGLGPVASWTPNDILVIDSLSMLSLAALNFVCSLNARLGQRPHQSDWGEGQGLIENLLQMLYSESVRCHVIINCHIKFIEVENGPTRGYPNTLGKALPPVVGRYFNNILMAQTRGSGVSQKRVILTNTSGVVELKNSAPLRIAREYSLETGLAEYFKATLGTAPGDKK